VKRIRVGVTLSPDEAARLDEMRPHGTSRSAYMRALLVAPQAFDGAPTHAEAIGILARLAREGRVGAAVALERALRADEGVSEPEGELARLLRGDD
jgi:hypothetical protein